MNNRVRKIVASKEADVIAIDSVDDTYWVGFVDGRLFILMKTPKGWAFCSRCDEPQFYFESREAAIDRAMTKHVVYASSSLEALIGKLLP